MVGAWTAHKVPIIKNKITKYVDVMKLIVVKKAAYMTDQEAQMLLDSGASSSVVSKHHIKVQELSPGQSIRLVSADGGTSHFWVHQE